MTGHAYRTSAQIASHTGPFEGYAPNADAMLRVIRKHRAAADEIDGDLVPEALLSAAKNAWDEAVALGERHGFRNAQATVLAPTGTIGFMMDCDTTGVEPDFSLVKSKKLVGGGEITIVNKTVPLGMEKLGYAPSEIDQIVAYIDERNSVVGAPHLKTEHYPVFDCAIGNRAIHYMGHVKMMGAVQPFISGAISKTVNLPETATVEEIAAMVLYRPIGEVLEDICRDLGVVMGDEVWAMLEMAVLEHRGSTVRLLKQDSERMDARLMPTPEEAADYHARGPSARLIGAGSFREPGRGPPIGPPLAGAV